jgi:hypothetical protein
MRAQLTDGGSAGAARSGRACNVLAHFPLMFTLLALVSMLSMLRSPEMARAADVVKFRITFSPDRLGEQISMHTIVSVANTDGGLPSPVTGFAMQIPKQLELIGSDLGLAICEPTPLLASGLSGCSPNAQMGSGSATVAVPFGPEIVSETANIDVLMGPPVEEQVGVLLYAESRTPVFAQLVFPGKLLIGGGPQTLDASFPPTPTLPGAPNAAMTHMTLTVGPEHLTYYRQVHGRRVGYRPTGVSLPTKCPRGGFLFVADMRFEDGTALRVPYAVPCPPTRQTRRH